MRLVHILMVSLFAVGMGIGQLLLKFSAQRNASHGDMTLPSRLLAMMFDWTFVLGAATYAALLFYWVWLLTFLPLSRAYPFTIISIAVATIGSYLFFSEQISRSFLIGFALVAAGLIVMTFD